MARLRPLVLKLLQEQPRNGYNIVKTIEDRTGWKPSYGSIYPVLESLEDDDFITSDEHEEETLYEPTEKGTSYDFKDEKQELYTELIETMRVLSILTGEDMKPVINMLERCRDEGPVEDVHPQLPKLRNAILKQALNDHKTDKLQQILQETRKQVEQL